MNTEKDIFYQTSPKGIQKLREGGFMADYKRQRNNLIIIIVASIITLINILLIIFR